MRSIPTCVAANVLLLLGAVSSSAAAQELLHEIVGANAGDALGTQVSTGGDLDADGSSEMLVTTRALDSSSTLVWAVEVRTGGSFALLRTHYGSGTAFFGGGTAFVGDLDGDGVSDYVCDSPDVVGAAHSAYLYSGASGAWLRTVALTVPTDLYAPAVRALGDVDADLIGDFAVTGTSAAGGAVDVVSGASGILLYTVTAARPWFAEDVASIPDANADGVDDLAVCESMYMAKNGVVWIYSGATGAKVSEFDGQKGDTFAASVARLQDVDGDGIDELMVGALRANGGAARSGAVYVYAGVTHKPMYRLIGDGVGYFFGRYLADAGDVNGDGVHDIAVAAPWILSSNTWNGPGHLFSGATGGELYRFEFAPASSWSGDGFASVGDVDGDGTGDLAIGDSELGAVPPGAGRVRIFGGNDLYLLATPRAPFATWPMELATREGATTQLVVTFVMDVNGSPMILPLTPVGTFDATGEWRVAGPVPPGLSGNVITFQSFAQRAGRGLRSSGLEVVTFQ